MKRYLVTGGAGFIGSNIVAALVKKGKKVRILDNFSEGKMEFLKPFKNDIEIMRGDVRRYADCHKAVKGIEVVMHQAALRSVIKSVMDPFATHDTDATGTLYMLEAARQRRVKRFVNASSSSVYGDAKRFPTTEESPFGALSPYAVAKLAAERYAFSYFVNYGLETVSLRYFNVFGPHQNPESIYSAVIPGFIERFKKDIAPMIFGDGKQSRDFTYVGDVVNANLLAAQSSKAKGEAFNIGAGEDHSIIGLYKDLATVMHKEHLKPIFKKRRPSDPDRTYADISKAKRILGWEPKTSFKEGLKKTVDWFS